MVGQRLPYQPRLQEASLPAVDKFFAAGITFGPTELLSIKGGQVDPIWKARAAELEAEGLTLRDLKALQRDLMEDLAVIPEKHASNLSFFTLPSGQKMTVVTSSFKLTKLFSYLR